MLIWAIPVEVQTPSVELQPRTWDGNTELGKTI